VFFYYVASGCRRNIREFEKETSLLDANLKTPEQIGVFPDETLEEIIEPYNEEYEIYWRGTV
jgi:hypothetical protein